MKINTKIEIYEALEEILSKIQPDVKIELIDAQYWLYNECFFSFVPCEFSLDITSGNIDKISNTLFNNSDKETIETVKKYPWLKDFILKVKENISNDSFCFF